MSFIKSKGFKYFKNYEWGGLAITIGLITEAILFFFLGILGPEKDYYWEKLYPGLDAYGSNIAPLAAGEGSGASRALNADAVEDRLGGMLHELQGMSASLGSLKALQEVDFSETSEQVKTMHNFYTKMNEAMGTLSETVEDTKQYKEQIESLNRNLSGLNTVYGNVLGAFRQGTNA